MRASFRYLFALALALTCVGITAADEVTYLHTDVLGSPIAATDENGTLLWEERYEPYGERYYEPAAASSNKRSFTGHAEDTSGLMYMGARYYNPEIGRFYQTDPGPLFAAGPGFVNRYAYVANTPTSGLDSDGRIIETVWDVASFSYGLYSFRQNVQAGNFGDATEDAFGVLGDGIATGIPFVPGGISMAIQARRATRAIMAANDAARGGGDTLQAILQIKSKVGNFNIGRMSRTQLDDLGLSWVGPNATALTKKGEQIGWASADGMKSYRFPLLKKNGQAAGTVQGNLTENIQLPNGKIEELRNAHVDLMP